MYAKACSWHPYLQSMMMFLLTCAGRAQDLYDVECEPFEEALRKNKPFKLTQKKTDEIHWYVPDKRSTKFILPYVQRRIECGHKTVWGTLAEQKGCQRRLTDVLKMLFTDEEY